MNDQTTQPKQQARESENSENSASQKVGESDDQIVSESAKPDEQKSEYSETPIVQPPDSSLPSEPSGSSEPSQPPAKDAKGAHWYVVHTHSGHEGKVAATLRQRVESQKIQDKILDILVPTQEKIEIKEGKKAKVKEKIFPGYLLIRMVLDDSTWLAVRTTPGITSFVGVANRPTPLPDREVVTIKRFMTMEAPKFKAAFSIGEAVKIIDGPFSEFLGSVSEIDEEKGKIKVLVSIFGRETPVELDFLQVAKL